MKYASVCSGVEAASLAWMPLGWEAAWFSEIEPFPCAVLKERFPDVPNIGDMTKIEGEKYRGTVDLLVGGTPCQGFSTAGKQGGLDDPRSALCLAYCRLLETMRPRWFVWENVPGVFSTNGGDDFRSFIRKIDEIGYSCAWRVLDAQYVRVDGYPRAVPQRRRRVFVVGYYGDWRYPASVLFEPGCLPGATPPRRIKGEGVAADAKGSIRETGEGVAPDAKGCNNEAGSGVFWNGNDYAETLKANCDKDRMPDKGRLNCVMDTRCKKPNGSTLVMATGQANAETATDHCVNLTCNHEAPIVCAGFSGGQGENAGGIGYQEEVAPTIRSNVKVGDRQTTGIGNNGDPLPTISSAHHHAVAMRQTVRRLLPIETERLMGFPDNWTRIPWRGKTEEQCPDGPRYKACGNSMCVNVMRWIGMRIEYVERIIGKRQDRIK